MKLHELFSFSTLRAQSPDEQIRFWKQRRMTGAVATVFALAAAGSIAYAQRDGGSRDLHQYVPPYVEHAVRENPGLDRDKFTTSMMNKADLYENGRVGLFLALSLVTGCGTGLCHNRMKMVQAQLK